MFAAAAFILQGIFSSLLEPLARLVSWAVGEPVRGYTWAPLLTVLGATIVALRLVDEEEWSAVALDDRAWRWRVVAAGWLIGSAVIACTSALLIAMGYLRFTSSAVPVDSMLVVDDSWLGTAVRLLFLLAPAALWEEMVFRGYLWRVAEDAGGARLALWSTSVAFGIVHLTNPGAGVRTTLLVTLAGLCLGMLRQRTGSVPAAWTAHLAWNWTMGAVLHVPVSGMPFAAPGYRAEVHGPAWLTGGTWGPEGGLVAALVLGGALMAGAWPRAGTGATHSRIEA